MPILPSHVGGSGPRDELDFEGSSDTVRLRQLCEVLLTSRAKMLGLSQSFAHRLSSLPADLKSSLVNGLGEIIAHLDSFEIRLGDTRLTGKVRLGADGGMEAHFEQGLVQGTGDRSPVTARRDSESELKRSSAHPALPAAGGGGVRRRRRGVGVEHEEPRPTVVAIVEPSGPYGALYGHARERARQGRSRVELSRAEHEELCFICVSVFESVTPVRPEGSYEERERSVGALEQAGYIRRRAGKWHPTPSGFEASGLLGAGRLELDP